MPKAVLTKDQSTSTRATLACTLTGPLKGKVCLGFMADETLPALNHVPRGLILDGLDSPGVTGLVCLNARIDGLCLRSPLQAIRGPLQGIHAFDKHQCVMCHSFLSCLKIPLVGKRMRCPRMKDTIYSFTRTLDGVINVTSQGCGLIHIALTTRSMMQRRPFHHSCKQMVSQAWHRRTYVPQYVLQP
jgi:hypothetical protein